jgi:hypothetical protein
MQNHILKPHQIINISKIIYIVLISALIVAVIPNIRMEKFLVVGCAIYT